MRLGPQGLAILNQQRIANGDQSFIGAQAQAPQALDFVINELVNPTASTTPTKILSYLAYYYPIIKNEQNVALLTFNFLKCPVFFNDGKVIAFNDNYKIIEFFNYVILHKFKISLPHLSFDKFYKSLIEGIIAFTRDDPNYHWKVVPVISGILSTIPERGLLKADGEIITIWQKALEISLNSDKSCINNFEVATTNLLATSFCIDYFPSRIHNYSAFLVDLIYLQKLNNGRLVSAIDWKADPVLKNLNKLALLIRQFTKSSSKMDLSIIIEKIVWFSENLNNGTNADDELLKTITFTNIVIFESIIDQSMLDKDQKFHVATSRKLLTIFYNLNFIIEKIGVGGFNAYNYIYYYSIDTLLEKDIKTLEILILTLLTRINLNLVASNPVQTSNLKFTLILIENVVVKLNAHLQRDLLLFVKDLINTPNNRFFQVQNDSFTSIVESAHSIMLKFLDLKFLSLKEVRDYMQLLLRQYPSVLSIHQIIICFKKILTNNANEYDYMSSELFDHVIYCPPNKLVENQELKTLRSSYVLLLIEILEFCPILKYQNDLLTCYNLIGQIGIEYDVQILRKQLFETIVNQNKIDNQKGELGIAFWYRVVEGRDYRL